LGLRLNELVQVSFCPEVVSPLPSAWEHHSGETGWRMVQDFTILKIGTEIDGGIIDVCPGCRRFELRQLNRTKGTEGELTFIHSQRIAEDGEFWVFEIIDQHAFKVTLNLPPQDEGEAETV
jgi:hypothetical protein